MRKEFIITGIFFLFFLTISNSFFSGCGQYSGPVGPDSTTTPTPTEVDSLYLKRQFEIYNKLDQLCQGVEQQSQYDYWVVQEKLQEIDELKQWMRSFEIGDSEVQVQINLGINTVVSHIYAVKPGFYPRSHAEAGAFRDEVDLFFDQRPRIRQMCKEGYWFWLNTTIASTDRISSAVLTGGKTFYHFAILHEATSDLRHMPYFLQEVVFSIIPAYLLEKYAKEKLNDLVLAEEALAYIKGWERQAYEFLDLFTQLNKNSDDNYIRVKSQNRT